METKQQPETLLPSHETLMAQAQVFASAWAIAGGRLDSGDGMEVANQEKAILADMFRRLHAENEILHAENESLRASFDTLRTGYDAARLEIASQHARIQELGQAARDVNSRRVVELESQLAAIRAGGVEPLRKRCLHQISEPSRHANPNTAAASVAAIEAMRAAIGALLNEFGDRNWQSGHGVSYESIEDAFEAIIERAALAAPAQSNLITIRKIATQAEAQMIDAKAMAPTDQSRAEFEIAWRSAEFQEACPYSSSKEVAFAIFKIARRAPAPAGQPVAVPAGFKPDIYLFQHEETGLTQFVDAQQVEWGFEKNNPRLKNIGPVFTAAQVQAMLAAEREECAKACDALANGTTAAQIGPPDALENVMLRQVATLGHSECAAAIRARNKP